VSSYSTWFEEAAAIVAGTYDPKKVLGVTKLDVVRAKAFIGQITGTDPKEVSIPVVGGHAGTTILPLLSQVGS
jgi:malate/lactate dehydrogenase